MKMKEVLKKREQTPAGVSLPFFIVVSHSSYQGYSILFFASFKCFPSSLKTLSAFGEVIREEATFVASLLFSAKKFFIRTLARFRATTSVSIRIINITSSYSICSFSLSPVEEISFFFGNVFSREFLVWVRNAEVISRACHRDIFSSCKSYLGFFYYLDYTKHSNAFFFDADILSWYLS